MVSRVDTATRHKREQCYYSFMHIYLLLLLFGQGERLFDWWAILTGRPFLTSFSGNAGAKFSKKIRFLNEASPPQRIRPVANWLV
jgi:hypothetical protein